MGKERIANKYLPNKPHTPGHLKGYDYVHIIEEPEPEPEPKRRQKEARAKRKKRSWYASGEYVKGWPEISKKVREESGYRCQKCGKYRPGKHGLVVHHIDEDKRNNDTSNLIVLCTVCHFKAHHNS